MMHSPVYIISFRSDSFRLLVFCTISYAGVVVYLSTGKLNLKIKLHVLIGHGEKMNLKLISFLYCVCNNPAVGYLCIYVLVIFSYFNL